MNRKSWEIDRIVFIYDSKDISLWLLLLVIWPILESMDYKGTILNMGFRPPTPTPPLPPPDLFNIPTEI